MGDDHKTPKQWLEDTSWENKESFHGARHSLRNSADTTWLSQHGGEAGALSTDTCFIGWALNAQCFWVLPVCLAHTPMGAAESPQIEKQRAVGTWGGKLSDAEDCLLQLQLKMCLRNGMYLSTIFSTFLPWIKHYVSLHLHYSAQSYCKCSSLRSCILPKVRDCVLFVSCLHLQGLGRTQGKVKGEGTVSRAIAWRINCINFSKNSSGIQGRSSQILLWNPLFPWGGLIANMTSILHSFPTLTLAVSVTYSGGMTTWLGLANRLLACLMQVHFEIAQVVVLGGSGSTALAMRTNLDWPAGGRRTRGAEPHWLGCPDWGHTRLAEIMSIPGL